MDTVDDRVLALDIFTLGDSYEGPGTGIDVEIDGNDYFLYAGDHRD